MDFFKQDVHLEKKYILGFAQLKKYSMFLLKMKIIKGCLLLIKIPNYFNQPGHLLFIKVNMIFVSNLVLSNVSPSNSKANLFSVLFSSKFLKEYFEIKISLGLCQNSLKMRKGTFFFAIYRPIPQFIPRESPNNLKVFSRKFIEKKLLSQLEGKPNISFLNKGDKKVS